MKFNKIEKYGIGINYNKYESEILMPLRKQQTELEDKIHSIIGYRNLDNPSQILRGLNIRGYDINSATLDEFKQRRVSDKIFNLLFQYKVNSAYLSQYGDKFKSYLDKDNRVHPHYRINSETTGRIGATAPAAMSFDSKLMKYLTAKEGCSLIHLDYKAMEFRVLAALSKDPILKRKLRCRSFDMHTENASIMFGKKTIDITDNERKTAKALGFAILYGMSAHTLSKKLSASMNREITEKEAYQYISDFYDRFPLVKLYHDDILFNRIPCSTLGGKEFSKQLKPSQRLNYPIQGTAAEAFIKLIETVEKTFPSYHICLPLHDALFIEVSTQDVDMALKEVKYVMEHFMTNYLSVPSFVDAEIYC